MDSREPFIITKVPNKLNIHYCVATKPDEKKRMLMPIVEDIKQNGRLAKKTLPNISRIFVKLVTELDSEDVLFIPSLSPVMIKNTFVSSIPLVLLQIQKITSSDLLPVPLEPFVQLLQQLPLG